MVRTTFPSEEVITISPPTPAHPLVAMPFTSTRDGQDDYCCAITGITGMGKNIGPGKLPVVPGKPPEYPGPGRGF